MTQEVLTERAKTHGDYSKTARVAQIIKQQLRDALLARAVELRLDVPDIIFESLDLISTKEARIVCGDPLEPDHYKDISGYALLVYNFLTTGKTTT